MTSLGLGWGDWEGVATPLELGQDVGAAQDEEIYLRAALGQFLLFGGGEASSCCRAGNSS